MTAEEKDSILNAWALLSVIIATLKDYFEDNEMVLGDPKKFFLERLKDAYKSLDDIVTKM